MMALIPPPRAHLISWGGCFAPNSSYRKEITLKPDIKKAFQFKSDAKEKSELKNGSWSRTLAKVFKIDVTICKKCGGDFAVAAAVVDQREIQRYLRYVGNSPLPPVRAPPKRGFNFEEF